MKNHKISYNFQQLINSWVFFKNFQSWGIYHCGQWDFIYCPAPYRPVNRSKMASGGRITNCMQSSSLYNRGFCDPWTWGSVEKTGLDGQNECQLLAESHLEEIRDWKWFFFFEKLGIDKFSMAGAHDCIFGVTFCKQKYLKKSMVNEWYYEKKMKIHQIGFNMMCVHGSWETCEYFFKILKFGYLSLRSMGL